MTGKLEVDRRDLCIRPSSWMQRRGKEEFWNDLGHIAAGILNEELFALF